MADSENHGWRLVAENQAGITTGDWLSRWKANGAAAASVVPYMKKGCPTAAFHSYNITMTFLQGCDTHGGAISY